MNIANIQVEEKLNQVQSAELKLAKKFHRLCKEMDINYVMLGGAMLGAIRHKGFIPWDDDLDFGLLREDYEKLFDFLNTEKGSLRVASYKNGNTHDYPFKIIDPSIKLINKNHKVQEEEYAWIDIFPIDGMPNNFLMRQVHKANLLKDRALLKLSQLSTGVALSNPNRNLIEKIIIKLGTALKIDRLLSEDKMMDRLDINLKKFHTKNSDFLVNFMGAYKFKEMFKREIYLSEKKYCFEDTFFYGIEKYDLYLNQLYGNYKKLPEIQDRDKHKMELKE
ncbi:LicD family protein [Pediococcus acidilactici]|uniref:LicD family protein n=1 Tax=Pediococcus acidilactici TaxID=1254 RepID=UPI00194E6C45|nr:LicD family protein [Pediococcus acidilactici]MBM6602587.1 LicD family protein [Pediococcus acidilactici]MBM6644364.1 LicD family protein [Pediococcus acidilactici]MCB5723670.1 LicD family protein [Pediococcus acidilactici]MCB5730310.1 LicD family protein [Pediococcus acidilactici]MCB5732132.1 LicD family protein [Pediococcus acidilactici]